VRIALYVDHHEFGRPCWYDAVADEYIIIVGPIPRRGSR